MAQPPRCCKCAAQTPPDAVITQRGGSGQPRAEAPTCIQPVGHKWLSTEILHGSSAPGGSPPGLHMSLGVDLGADRCQNRMFQLPLHLRQACQKARAPAMARSRAF